MGFNLQIRCKTCAVHMGVLRGKESAAIAVFGSEHGKEHEKEIQVDNGFSSPEWGPGEGFEEKFFPDDWPEDARK
jgi:hypothetical protein